MIFAHAQYESSIQPGKTFYYDSGRQHKNLPVIMVQHICSAFAFERFPKRGSEQLINYQNEEGLQHHMECVKHTPFYIYVVFWVLLSVSVGWFVGLFCNLAVEWGINGFGVRVVLAAAGCSVVCRGALLLDFICRWLYRWVMNWMITQKNLLRVL